MASARSTMPMARSTPAQKPRGLASRTSMSAILGAFAPRRPAFGRRGAKAPRIALMGGPLANPPGFCAGGERAIGILGRALARHGAPVHVRPQAVPHKYVGAAL